MQDPCGRVPRRRLLLVVVAGTALAGGAASLALPVAGRAARHRAAPDAAPPADLLAGLAALALLACVVWLWAAALVSAARLAARPAAAAPAPGVPRFVHRAVLTGCGLVLAGGALTPAAAVPTPLTEGPGRAAPSATTTPAATPTATPAGTWTVRPGDTLWAIAAASLGPAPPDGAVAARVRELHHLNRAAVPDPDLIHPGQLLRLPTA